jgi:asparagine synthase (glutamine-hydrolysing)
MTIAGVLDLFGAAACEPLRARLGSTGASLLEGQGPLALACSEEVEREQTDGFLCLFEGNLHNGDELARRFSLPASLSAGALVIQAYRELGAALWPLLRGDFVVVVWEPEACRGAVVRDHLGGRALFLHRSGNGLAFATELHDLLELLPTRPAPDDVAVAQWLLSSVVPEERTLFAGIEEVPPASCLELGVNGVRTQCYWAPQFEQQRGLSFAEASVQARELLVQAVERRAGNGQESAILLSGGIDSASVAGISCSFLPEEQQPQRAYSAVFPRHPEIDEGTLIADVAAHNRLQATAIEAAPGGLLVAVVPYIERWQALSPTPNLSFLRPLLDRAAADGVRLLHDGEGGDAVFWFSAPLLAERLRHGRLLSAWSLAGRFPGYGVPTSWRTRLDKLRQWGRRRDFSPSPPTWLSVPPGLLEAEDHLPQVEGPAWWVAKVAGILGPGSRMAHDATRRDNALSGIEASHPLLDVDLIEGVLSFPPELAFEPRFNRPVLREAVAGLVPDEARLRPYKSNFDPVIVAGMEADLPLVEALLLRPGAHIGSYTDRDCLAAHIASPPQPLGARRAWAMSLWFLGTMECWLRLQAAEEVLPADALSSICRPRYSFSSF